MKKNCFFVFCLLVGVTTTVALPVPYSVDSYLSKGTSLTVGWAGNRSESYTRVSLGTMMEWKPFGLGVDLNGYFPNGTIGKSHFDLTVKKASWLTRDYGVEWGRLAGLTLGEGMIMDAYDTGSGGDVAEMTPQKTGGHVYARLGPVGIEGLYTARHLMGARLTYTDSNSIFLGNTVRLGGTYVTDPDGVSANAGATGYSVDLSTPLIGDFLVLYGEAAQLKDHGKGGGAGLRGNVFDGLSYCAEYRVLGADFVPGYFGATYEQAPVRLGGVRKEGVLLGLGWVGMDLFTVNTRLESYQNDQLLSGELGFKPILGVSAVLHYTQPYKGDTLPMLQAQAAVMSFGPWEILGDFRQIYGVTETDTHYSVGVRTSVTRLLGLPF